MYEPAPHQKLFAERDDPQPYRDLAALLEREEASVIGANGEPVAMPPQLQHALLALARLFAAERAALIETVSRDPITQHAAALINVPHDVFPEDVNGGKVPSTTEETAGGYTRQRIRLGGLFAYNDERRAKRRRVLDELFRMSEAAGEYDVTPEEIAAFTERVRLMLFNAAPATMTRILRDQAAALTRPPQSASQVLAALATEVSAFAVTVEQHLQGGGTE